MGEFLAPVGVVVVVFPSQLLLVVVRRRRVPTTRTGIQTVNGSVCGIFSAVTKTAADEKKGRDGQHNSHEAKIVFLFDSEATKP